MGIAEVLTIVFVVLKLTGYITWAWWLVLLPEIIAVSFYLLVFLFIILGFSGFSFMQFRRKRRR